MEKKPQLWLAITLICLKTASSSFPKYRSDSFWRACSQCCHNILRDGNMPNWDIYEMQLSPGRHGKCLKHSDKNCFCIISFFSFAVVFWNISWLTVIFSAFESFPLKRGVAVLLLPQTSEKCFFSTSFLLQPSTSGLTHPSLVWYMSHQYCSLQSYRLLLAKQIKGTSAYLPVCQLS